MQIKLCDACRRSPDLDLRLELRVATIQYDRGSLTDLDWWFGKKSEIDLCNDCLRAIFASRKAAD